MEIKEFCKPTHTIADCREEACDGTCEFAFAPKHATYIDWLKDRERELALKLGQPEVMTNKRRKDTIGMMLDITKDAIDREGF